MSKKITLSLIITLVLTLLVSGIAFADDGDSNPKQRGGRRAYGEVVSVEEETFTVQNPKGEEVTFSVDENTRFRAPNEEEVTFADLEIGQEVAVLAGKDSLAKLVILLPDDFEPGDRFGVRKRGEITAVDVEAGTFSLQTPNEEELAFTVDDNTRYKGQLESLDEMQIGWSAGVAAKEQEGGTLLAAAVIAGERPEMTKARGEVTTVDAGAGTFTITAQDGQTLTFTVDENTRYKGQLESLDEMQIGWSAGVAAKEQEDGTLLAAAVIAGERPEIVKGRGEVTTVDAGAGTFTLTAQDGQTLTFTVDENTRYKGQLTSFDEMQVGWSAGVAAKEQEDGTLLAAAVIAGERPEMTKARGEVTTVDAEASTFTLTTQDGQTLTFTVDENTRFKGQLESLDEMQVGWSAGVAAKEQEDGNLLAVFVIAGDRTAQHPPAQNPNTP